MKKEVKNTILEFIKKQNEDFEDGTIITEPIVIDSISTGSFSLDKAIGIGGLPRGRIVEIWGLESTGKSALALSVIAQVQKAGGRAGYIDSEQAMSPEFAESMGVKFKDIVLTQLSVAEDALTMLERMIDSKLFDIIVVDSVAELVSRREAEGEMGDQNMGVIAKLMGQSLRKINASCRKNNVLVIFINQIRYKIGIVYGSPETTPGGKALGFKASVRIKLTKGKKIVDENDVPIGVEIEAYVSKNKVAPPFKKANYQILFSKGISLGSDIFNVALEEKLITKTGNTYFFGDEKIGVGQQKCYAELEANEKLRNKIIEKLKI